MITVFIDTSVLFSAYLSKIGASALILGFCRKNKIKGFISRYVLSEVKRNAAQKLDQTGKQRLNFYILQAHLTIIDNPTSTEILRHGTIIHSKDAPILAAAVKSGASYLVKHPVILTPRDFILFKIFFYKRSLI